MFSHVMLGADDLDAARAFYDAALGALGIAPGQLDARGRLVYSSGSVRFLVTRPIDGAPARPAHGGTIGFAAASPEAVRGWHAAGLAAGGTAIEDPPGIREATENRRLYLAYLRDPAGNKLCAAHRLA
ncbi:VOC family protein [Sphingomonas morindae]|uniref:VOC family protein n=1 Tax=Sphingomonas morindae TaxID=1541170 RepID=A0ABY4XAU5_9SPHN|nr:VOC family protein [Sphingomonas morindae]USI73983.1 VOC family protein [Sphingomonas morindae]